MKQEYQDRIDLYVTGRMTEEEMSAFEEEINNNPELREQAEFTKTVRESLKSRNEKLEKMKAFEREYETNSDNKDVSDASARNKFKFFYWASSIAAVLVVGFFVMKSINTTSDNMAFPIELAYENSRGGGNDLNELKQLIENEKCDEALSQIEKLLKSNKDELDSINNDNTIDEEEKEYDMADINEENDNLKWLKAHALIRLGKKDEAKELLNEIRRREGVYKEKADSIYNELFK